jgi:hypothetical protein
MNLLPMHPQLVRNSPTIIVPLLARVFELSTQLQIDALMRGWSNKLENHMILFTGRHKSLAVF